MLLEGSNLLFNLLVILITMAIHQFWIESKPNSPFVKNYAILFTSALAIFLCMSFSIVEEDGIKFDLRRVPLWLGTIYGGPLIGILLSLETMLIRFFQGGIGGIISLFSTPLLLAIALLVRPYYFRLRTLNKVMVAAIINILISIFILISVSMAKNTLVDIKFFTSYLMTNFFGIIFVSLSFEAIRKNYLFRMKIYHSAKLDLIGHLAAAVNHEIKNPLTTVRGMIHLLKDDPSLPNEKKESFFQIAMEEIDKIDRIVSDYLTFARPYPNKIEMLPIGQVLSESISIVKPLADQASVKIEIKEISHCTIPGDHSKFVQALVNILKNSIDALPNGGSIEIKAVIMNNLCSIHILDNGVGMSSEIISRLGEPYFTMTSNGTGLGMMVVFKIIESMKGKISINSELGTGTEVILSLPSS
ncbi:ATP-binding protein [Cytobacillus dafuensis]|uniref:histidine kinase n=1 Tax=Cytobacillus dafuensis TaxID=1742359 RepID=A0A5B8Z884_CYTDA|nr:sensor histidine kinase [Cytobacillus dafuensis]QED49292.1 hypothetical protein FSZ17_19635 [Cytobacillus dafuensis]